MADEEKAFASPVLRIGAVVMILGAVALLAQVVVLLTLSDEAVIEMAKATTRMQRDKPQRGESPSQMMARRQLTDAEIDKMIESEREKVLARIRPKLINNSTMVMKAVCTLLLIGTAAGVLMKRRSPTRLLAGITGVILLVVSLGIFAAIGEMFELYEYYVNTLTYSTDLATTVLLPLSAVACFLVLGLVKRERPKPSPPAGGQAGPAA